MKKSTGLGWILVAFSIILSAWTIAGGSISKATGTYADGAYIDDNGELAGDTYTDNDVYSSKNVVLPNTVTKISRSYYAGSDILSIRAITDNANTIRIEDMAFQNCTSLTTVNLANGGIDSNATIPNIFKGCTRLTDITLKDYVTDTKTGCLYDSNGVLVYVPAGAGTVNGSITYLELADGSDNRPTCTGIAANAFNDSVVTYLVVPDNVTLSSFGAQDIGWINKLNTVYCRDGQNLVEQQIDEFNTERRASGVRDADDLIDIVNEKTYTTEEKPENNVVTLTVKDVLYTDSSYTTVADSKVRTGEGGDVTKGSTYTFSNKLSTITFNSPTGYWTMEDSEKADKTGTATADTTIEFRYIVAYYYTVTAGGDGTVAKNSGTYSITTNAPSNKLKKVTVNGVALTSGTDYTSTGDSSSNTITFTANRINNMSVGSNSIQVVYTDGVATTTLTVTDASNNNNGTNGGTTGGNTGGSTNKPSGGAGGSAGGSNNSGNNNSGSNNSGSNYPRKYNIINGYNASIPSNYGAFAITADGEYSKFSNEVLLNGTAIDKSNYTSASGSTVITFKDTYIANLKTGTYTIRVKFTDGYAETNLTITPAETKTTTTVTYQVNADGTVSKGHEKDATPKTADGFDERLLLCMAIMLCGIGVLIISKQKKAVILSTRRDDED